MLQLSLTVPLCAVSLHFMPTTRQFPNDGHPTLSNHSAPSVCGIRGHAPRLAQEVPQQLDLQQALPSCPHRCACLCFVHIYTYIHIYIYTYIHVYMYTSIHIYIYTYTYTHTYRYAYIYIYIYMYVCKYTYPYTYTCIHIYSYIYTHKYTYFWQMYAVQQSRRMSTLGSRWLLRMSDRRRGWSDTPGRQLNKKPPDRSVVRPIPC